MLFFLRNDFFDYYNEYSFTLILFNILAYIFILINIFLIFFVFDMKYLKTLNELKFFGNLPVVTVFLVLLLLSFAGIPPLLGFLSKFLVFMFIFSKHNFFFLLFLLFQICLSYIFIYKI